MAGVSSQNKVSSLTHPLVKKIGLDDADCVISGDTAARAKPFPDPLFAAAEALDVAPGDAGLSESNYAIFRPANQPERPRLRPVGILYRSPDMECRFSRRKTFTHTGSDQYTARCMKSHLYLHNKKASLSLAFLLIQND